MPYVHCETCFFRLAAFLHADVTALVTMASYRILFGIVALYLSSLTCLCAATVLDNLQESFKPPAISYSPHVFYHWVNGNIRKAALEEDVEAMLEAGLGGALISDVNAGIPQGRIEYESDKWLDLLIYTVDAFNKKGLLAAIHNAPGYSGIGSKNLPVNMTVEEPVWTKTRVSRSILYISTITFQQDGCLQRSLHLYLPCSAR